MAMVVRIALAGLVALGLAACDTNPQAGTAGSEAGNALTLEVRDTAGRPVALARVEVRTSGAADTGSVAQGLTGPDGRVRLALPAGNWSILSRKDQFAAWSEASPLDTLVVDTIRPTAALSGFLQNAPGERLFFPGLGMSVQCDGDGYFQLPSLPEGDLPVQVGTGSSTSRLRITSGEDALVLDRPADTSSVWPSLPADSLVSWASQSIPANLPALALGDTGSFSVAVRLRRTDSTQPMTALHWGDSSGNGIQIGWKGCDTFVLRVDRIPYRVTGFALSTDLEQVGLSWDGHRLAVLRGTDSVITLTTEALADRTGWRDPLFGTAGIAQVQWIAFHRGNTFQDWLRRLAKLSLATPSRGADSLNVP